MIGWQKTTEVLYSFVMAVITKYHKLVGLNVGNVLSQFWRLEA